MNSPGIIVIKWGVVLFQLIVFLIPIILALLLFIQSSKNKRKIVELEQRIIQLEQNKQT